MKIAQVSPYDAAHPGGVMEHVTGLARHLRRRGHECHILAPCSYDDDREPPAGTIYVTRTVLNVPYSGSIARISLSPRLYRRVKKLLAQERYDVIHLHEPVAPALPYVVLRHSKSLNIGTFHGYRTSHRAFALTKPILENLVLEKLHGRIVVSEVVTEYISRYFDGEYEVIPNGVDLEHFGDPAAQPLPEYRDGAFNILFLGRLEKRKGFKTLIRAFPYIKAVLPNARLIVAGGFTRDDTWAFRRYIRRHRLTDVEFVGYVGREELPRYYRTADLFCSPALGFESFGLVLLEAMAAGTPVVASDIPGYRTVLQEGVQGLRVPPEDERSLARAVVALAEDPERRSRMGRAGRRRAAEFDWSIITGRVLDHYERARAHQRQLAGGSPRGTTL